MRFKLFYQLSTDYLLKILDKLRHTFPESRKVSLYSGLNDFRRKSLSELEELKSAGITMAYAGIESGDAVVLENIKKRMTPEQIAPMALAIQPSTVMEHEVKGGKFIMPTQLQILEEEKYLLENLNIDTFYWGDHGNNIVTQTFAW